LALRVIGIDLGTTNSVAAAWTETGPQLIPNALGTMLTPSVVGLDDDNALLVGQAARSRLVSYPDRTVASFKRWMGSGRETKLGRGRAFRPEELSAFVLKSLKADAEAHLAGPVDEAVISVPAYFNDIQRKATLDAARLAGLKVERLVNEPTAAALAYGLESRKEGLFLVFDLGGGTFDVSLLESFEGVMEVRATAGDTFLGGDDFTRAIADLFAGQHKLDLEALPRPDLARLLRAAEGVKLALTSSRLAEYEIRIGERTCSGSLARERFEEAVTPLLARVRAPLERALRDSGNRLREIDGIALVGGATRMPMIRSLVARFFGQLPLVTIDPDLAVGLGAAVLAGLKIRHKSLDEIVMTDVCPFTLGTMVMRSAHTRDSTLVMLPIIERNSAVPISRSQIVQTLQEDQRKLHIPVYQGESLRPENNILLGDIEIEVPPGPAGRECAEIRFTYDVNGALEVEVKALSTGETQRRVFRNASNLSPSDVDKRFAQLAQIKMAPREQAANRALLARAESLYEELLANERDELAELIESFERRINDPQARDLDSVRGEFATRLEVIERSAIRLS
jgi:molecular chaperone HscC